MTHLPRPELPFAARLIVAPFLAIALLSTFTGAATAHVQREDGQDQRSKTPPPPTPTVGYDISYPQCGGRYPANPAFAIVRVNRGVGFKANPCLGKGTAGPSQPQGGGNDAQLHAKTGNPGPQASSPRAPDPTPPPRAAAR